MRVGFFARVPSRDILETVPPDILRHKLRRNALLGENLRMDAHDQQFFVVRPVEYPDASALRQADRAAPHEIVIEFLR